MTQGYRPDEYTSAGPTMLTKVLENICSLSARNRALWTRKRCAGIKLVPKETFYPVDWKNYHKIINTTTLNEVLESSKNSVLIHVWNHFSKQYWFKTGTKNAYHVIAEEKCPMIYANSTIF